MAEYTQPKGRKSMITAQTHKLILQVTEISSRIGFMDLKSKPAARFIVEYAHTANKPDDVKQHFFNQLLKVLDDTPAHRAVIILGDFNARLHHRYPGEDPHVGPHNFGKGRTYLENIPKHTGQPHHVCGLCHQQ